MAQPGDCAHNKLNTTQATQLNMIAKFIDPRQNTNTPYAPLENILCLRKTSDYDMGIPIKQKLYIASGCLR
jgi:hypothetical protein